MLTWDTDVPMVVAGFNSFELTVPGSEGGEFDLTDASYGAKNWLVSFANTLEQQTIIKLARAL